jgi:hypothetical protein
LHKIVFHEDIWSVHLMGAVSGTTNEYPEVVLGAKLVVSCAVVPFEHQLPY